ncbi:MAG TPA: hypothetical protein PKE12_14785 [Kiritimatiellia bacterium]|nr:hypothetical protein [Kiritimatiellia bacterium]
MKKLLLAACVLLGLSAAVRADSSLGLGLRVFRTTDSLPGLFTEMGMGGVVGWRTYWTEYVSGQFDLAFYEEGYAGSPKEVLSPQAFLLFGREWYAGFGAGILATGGDLADAPFLILRAGYQKAWTDWLSLDFNVSYEYAEWEGVNEFDESKDSDTLVFGAGLRIAF